MIQIARSTDTEYFLSVLRRPGIWKAVSCGMPGKPEDIFSSDAELICYVAQEGEERRGFMVFQRLTQGAWIIHNVLLTIGLRSIRVIAMALKQIAKDTGCHTIISYVPPGNKAALAMVQRFAVESEEIRPFLKVPDNFRIFTHLCQ